MSLDQLLEWIPAGGPEEALARQVEFDRLPRHVAIIMDGNGRWAGERHLPRVEGHRAGVDAVRDVVESSARLGLEVLTLYAFSVENWKRPAAEVSTLMMLLKRYLRPRACHAAAQQHPLQRDRPRRRALARRAHGTARRGAEDGEEHRHALQHRAQLRRAHGDRRRGAARDGVRRQSRTTSTRIASPASSTRRASRIPIC